MGEHHDHEHAFFAHEDPRYLICVCGQYAVRTRDMIGQSSVRLIDPPQPALRITVPAARSAAPDVALDVEHLEVQAV